MSVTIFNIAEIAAVSPSTVSLALRESPKISEKTRIRVKAVARELNYQPSAIAKSLAMGKTHTIGVILPDALNPIYTEISSYIEQFCSKEGYDIFIYFVNGDPARERRFLESVYERRVDGLIVMPSYPESNRNCLTKLAEDAVPMVIRDIIEWLPKVDIVTIDLEEGAYMATKHLIDSGHRKIACMHSEFALGRTGGRVKGYKRALSENRIVSDSALIMPCGIRPIDGYTVTKEILSSKNVTAIFMHNDLLAIGAFKAIREKGLKVPDDIAIVGFDDLEISKFLEVPLTSIAHPKAEVGRLLGQTIIERIRCGEVKVKHILLKPKLVIRESTKRGIAG